MEYSLAEMSCVLKVKTQCEPCKIKVMQVLRNIHGVYNITIDGEQGTVKVSGTVNPTTFLGVLEKYGKHAEVKFIRFDGEVVERRSHYYGEYGYNGHDPHGMEGSYPQLGCHQHQWYPRSLPPPPPPHPPPPLAPYRVAPPPPPPPVAPYWGPPPRPYGPLPSHCPRGNKIVLPEENHCAVM